ncbi:MAG: hypothetical protein NT068_01920 [Candidatus Nomurabacteria bacterium]|nr:hypothetical protein [Candidatus Nomurabacteria bacterium]
MKNENNILIKVFLAILFNAVFVFGFIYLYNQINNKNISAASLTEQINTETDRRDKITALNSEIKAIAKERGMLATHFAKSSDVVPFLDNLQALAKSVGATAEVSSLDLTAEGGGLEVKMKATGSFVSVYKLLSLLENSQYELDFSSVIFNTVSALDNTGSLKTGNQKWDASFNLTLLSFES